MKRFELFPGGCCQDRHEKPSRQCRERKFRAQGQKRQSRANETHEHCAKAR